MRQSVSEHQITEVFVNCDNNSIRGNCIGENVGIFCTRHQLCDSLYVHSFSTQM